jgi:hypothetical protein
LGGSFTPPPIPIDPTKPPGPGWGWRGIGSPGSSNGNWVGPNGDKLHPDLKHREPKGPHWNWKDRYGIKWDYFPDKNKWVPDPKNNPNRPQPIFPPGTLETIEYVVVGACGAYVVYRIVRFAPSLFPPFWPTIPANVAIP